MTTPPGAGAASPTQPGAGAAPSGNMLTRKLGPLPMWAWMGLGLGLAIGVASWKSNAASKKPTDDTTDTDTTPAADVPPFIIQNYNSTTPTTPTTPTPTTPTPTKPTPAPTQTFVAYKTKHGDTMTSIAKAHHLGSWADVLYATMTQYQQKPTTVLKGHIQSLKRAGPKGRLNSGMTIYLPKK